MADGCLPALSEVASGSNHTESKAKVAELTRLASGKDIKIIFTIDATNGPELTDENMISDYFPADGYVFQDADGLVISANLTESGRTFFFESNGDIPDGAFYYRMLRNEPMTEAREWINTKMNVNETDNIVEITDGVETLWDANQNLDAPR